MAMSQTKTDFYMRSVRDSVRSAGESKLKKLIVLFLCILTAFTLCACKGKGKNDKGASSEVSSSQQTEKTNTDSEEAASGNSETGSQSTGSSSQVVHSAYNEELGTITGIGTFTPQESGTASSSESAESGSSGTEESGSSGSEESTASDDPYIPGYY